MLPIGRTRATPQFCSFAGLLLLLFGTANRLPETTAEARPRTPLQGINARRGNSVAAPAALGLKSRGLRAGLRGLETSSADSSQCLDHKSSLLDAVGGTSTHSRPPQNATRTMHGNTRHSARAAAGHDDSMHSDDEIGDDELESVESGLIDLVEEELYSQKSCRTAASSDAPRACKGIATGKKTLAEVLQIQSEHKRVSTKQDARQTAREKSTSTLRKSGQKIDRRRVQHVGRAPADDGSSVSSEEKPPEVCTTISDNKATRQRRAREEDAHAVGGWCHHPQVGEEDSIYEETVAPSHVRLSDLEDEDESSMQMPPSTSSSNTPAHANRPRAGGKVGKGEGSTRGGSGRGRGGGHEDSYRSGSDEEEVSTDEQVQIR